MGCKTVFDRSRPVSDYRRNGSADTWKPNSKPTPSDSTATDELRIALAVDGRYGASAKNTHV
jgi:hypothetical protein